MFKVQLRLMKDMEFRKMVTITLYARQQKRHRCIEQFFGLWERERVGWFGRMALKHVYYHIKNKPPVQVWCRIQDAWGWCTGMTQRDGMGREVGGAFMIGNTWRIHVDVWQNQYSIVKQNKVKLKKRERESRGGYTNVRKNRLQIKKN